MHRHRGRAELADDDAGRVVGETGGVEETAVTRNTPWRWKPAGAAGASASAGTAGDSPHTSISAGRERRMDGDSRRSALAAHDVEQLVVGQLADGAHAIDVDNERTYRIAALLMEKRAA